MRSLGENLTDQELNEMMKAADANGDGIINFNGIFSKNLPYFLYTNTCILEFQEVWTEARHVDMK